jgi:hypothetical protein
MAIAAGGIHTVVLKNNGSVLAWGGNDSGETTVPVAAQNGVVAIAAGASRSVALKTNGAVVAWGYNYNGQSTVPTEAQSGVLAIAAGGDHTVALKTNGLVVAWGDNTYGQTGVPLAAQSEVVAIAGGGDHTVAVRNDGSVVAWGANDSGQTTVPSGLNGVTAVKAGYAHTVALLHAAPLLPSLNTRASGNKLILTWPASATGFVLQSTPDLAAPVTWVDSTNQPAVLGGQFTVTNTISTSVQYYRLRKP